MALKTDISGYQKGMVRSAISFALNGGVAQVRQRFEHYPALCQKFEKQYGMHSSEFSRKLDACTLGDDADYFDWYAAKRGLDIWREWLEILSGVSV